MTPKESAPVTKVDNYINGAFVPPSTGKYMDVLNPADGSTIAHVGLSNQLDVQTAIDAASAAFPQWRDRTIKARAAIMMKFHALVQQQATQLAELITQENGKNSTEAMAEVAKGNETVEYACSLPQLAQGSILQVSSGNVTCRDVRQPLGIVTSIVPFNFPFMVPMWTIPIALVMGNCVILKPSEKVPLTMQFAATLMKQAGVPDGVFQMIQGTKDAVTPLMQSPAIQAVTFVGSSPIAKLVATTCRSLHKRCTALGGAKNHLVALDDCAVDSTAADVCVSFAGCAGQRCMAASVLLLTPGDHQTAVIDALVAKAKAIQPGQGPGQLGPVIDDASYQKILKYIDLAETQDKAQVLLDGRSWKRNQGNWIGPTILLHKSSSDKTMQEEVFGPVISIYKCESWEEAVDIENKNPFGNAACIYTTNGANADWFLSRFRAAMLGVNIGIPVPREPFSFGGLYGTESKYGDVDITGDGGVEFFSNRIKVTSKWPLQRTTTKRSIDQVSGTKATITNKMPKDHANFAGSM